MATLPLWSGCFGAVFGLLYPWVPWNGKCGTAYVFRFGPDYWPLVPLWPPWRRSNLWVMFKGEIFLYEGIQCDLCRCSSNGINFICFNSERNRLLGTSMVNFMIYSKFFLLPVPPLKKIISSWVTWSIGGLTVWRLSSLFSPTRYQLPKSVPLILQIRYPSMVNMIRGNHECRELSQTYGTYKECLIKYGHVNVWLTLCDVFDWLPIAASIGNGIFAVHGGLSPEAKTMDHIDTITRNIEVRDPTKPSDPHSNYM